MGIDRSRYREQPAAVTPAAPAGPSIADLTTQAQQAYDAFIILIDDYKTTASTKISEITTYVSEATSKVSEITGLKADATTAKTDAESAASAANTSKTEAQSSASAAATAKTEAQAKKTEMEDLAQTTQTEMAGYKQRALDAATLAEEHMNAADISRKAALASSTEAERLMNNTRTALIAAGVSMNGSVASEVAGKAGFQNRIIEGVENISAAETSELERLRRYAQDNTYAFRSTLGNARLLQASELLAQKESVANNIIMDYMYANVKGTTVNTVMDRLTQLNNDKKRKLEINTYYGKVYNQYINILKVIVLACIIIVPLVIANKNSMIPNSIFMFSTVGIIFFTIIFIFYSFSDIYMRDNIDFDKIQFPYDREGALLEKDGSIIKKKNPLTSLTLTCIGQDCCDGSMVYDYARNKCLATENFGGMFDEAANNCSKREIIYPNSTESFINNCNFKNTLYQSSLNCSSLDKFVTNECINTVRISD
jgi:hypothetical protein